MLVWLPLQRGWTHRRLGLLLDCPAVAGAGKVGDVYPRCISQGWQEVKLPADLVDIWPYQQEQGKPEIALKRTWIPLESIFYSKGKNIKLVLLRSDETTWAPREWWEKRHQRRKWEKATLLPRKTS